MAVRTTRLAVGSSSSTSELTLYTCPSGRVAIVKDLWLRNGASVARDVYWGIRSGGTFYAKLTKALASDASIDEHGLFRVLAAGEALVAQIATGGPLLWWVGGAELLLPG